MARSLAPTNKAVAATGGSAFGAAVATLILYFIGQDFPPEVNAAITTIVTALVTGIAAYFTPASAGDRAPAT